MTTTRSMEKVSVTRLKANLAHYLSMLKAGRSFVVTNGGLAVAVFEPVAWNREEYEAMNRFASTVQVTPPSQELPDDFFEKSRFKDAHGLLRRHLLEERGSSR